MPTLDILDRAMLYPGPNLPVIGRVGGGQIAMAEPDRPWRVVGMDAAVYQLRQPTGRVIALRFPFADAEDRALRDRYRALASDARLKPLKEAPGTPIVGGINYIPDGLLLPARDLRSAPHPVVVMDWVMGPTLLAAVDRACRGADRPYLAALAQAWLSAVSILAAHAFVHADFTADNTLVRPGGGIALVDYDTAAWSGGPPPVPVRPSPAYAHPTGQPVPPPGRRDDFAALVIYASLRALAERPDLRPQFGDPTSEPGGALLFAAKDLVDPAASPVFRSLRGTSPELATLLDILSRACLGPADKIPTLGDVMPELSRAHTATPAAPPHVSTPVSPPATSPSPAALPVDVPRPSDSSSPPRGPAAAPPQPGWGRPGESTAPVDPFDWQSRITRLNSLLMGRDDDATVEFWRSSGLASDQEVVREYGPRIAEVEQRRVLRQARRAAETNDSKGLLHLWDQWRLEQNPNAASLRPIVDAARRRTAQVDRLRNALEANDIAGVMILWPELRGDPLVSTLAIPVSLTLKRAMDTALARAVERGDDPALLAALREVEAAGMPVPAEARRAGRAAATREATRVRLKAALAADDRSALADLALSGRLDDLSALDPETTRTVLRALHWPVLADAFESDDDRTIVTVYDAQAELYDDHSFDRELKARVDLARSRLIWLGEVRIALRKRDAATLRMAMQATPPGAAEQLSSVERSRVERLTRRDSAAKNLHRAFQDGNDEGILVALGQIRESGAALPDGVDWDTLRRIADRTDLADALRRALSSNPPDYARLSTLLPTARAAEETRGEPLIPGVDLATLERDVLRAAQVARLREALAANDDHAIAAAAHPDPLNALAVLTPDQRQRVQLALAGAAGTGGAGVTEEALGVRR